MMKRGIFGCDLKHQVTVIGITYCALSILGIAFGSLLVDRPERFADQNLRDDTDRELSEERKVLFNDLEQNEEDTVLPDYATEQTNATLSDESSEMEGSDDDDILESLIEYSEENFDDFDNMTSQEREAGGTNNYDDILKEDIIVEEAMEKIEPSSEMKSYQKMIRYIKNEGIEAIIGSFIKLLCSVLLVQGARMGKPWLLVPWLVEELIEMVGGFIHFTIQAARNKEWSLGGLLMGVLFYLLGCYFLYTVASFHSLLRRMNKNSSMIVASVSQVHGGFQTGMNYQRLEEECWQSEPNLATEFGSNGFVREKKVDLEEDGDEHVLYVQ
eukprot:GFUD01030071.1.p1 GENE.GFUD01030071.1~~GFUD01030071.1.p1  ORF type:complete len:328 (+),score=95.45 GFUD01030071.1:75-1058(+)